MMVFGFGDLAHLLGKFERLREVLKFIYPHQSGNPRYFVDFPFR